MPFFQSESLRQLPIFIGTLSATCRLPVHEIMKTDCETHATCNQTRYNEEKKVITEMEVQPINLSLEQNTVEEKANSKKTG